MVLAQKFSKSTLSERSESAAFLGIEFAFVLRIKHVSKSSGATLLSKVNVFIFLVDTDNKLAHLFSNSDCLQICRAFLKALNDGVPEQIYVEGR